MTIVFHACFTNKCGVDHTFCIDTYSDDFNLGDTHESDFWQCEFSYKVMTMAVYNHNKMSPQDSDYIISTYQFTSGDRYLSTFQIMNMIQEMEPIHTFCLPATFDLSDGHFQYYKILKEYFQGTFFNPVCYEIKADCYVPYVGYRIKNILEGKERVDVTECAHVAPKKAQSKFVKQVKRQK